MLEAVNSLDEKSAAHLLSTSASVNLWSTPRSTEESRGRALIQNT